LFIAHTFSCSNRQIYSIKKELLLARFLLIQY